VNLSNINMSEIDTKHFEQLVIVIIRQTPINTLELTNCDIYLTQGIIEAI